MTSGMCERLLRAERLVIVVVEDDDAYRRSIARLLRLYGHEVHVFGSSEGYLVRGRDADCAVVDIPLPGMSGLELERSMRQAHHRAGVVFISAHNDPRTRAAVEDAARELLTKPFDDEDLLDAIARAAAGAALPDRA
ncbi:MAG TPA: response regulator [Vicinamibacterales bacterium]|nr:response regulator [Vicinamibacterales bacterium]